MEQKIFSEMLSRDLLEKTKNKIKSTSKFNEKKFSNQERFKQQ